MPGSQPRGRTGQAYRSAAEPVTGHVNMTFDDVDHYRRWLTNSITRTMERAIKRRRHLAVAATGVRRDVACDLALLSFPDGTADSTSSWSATGSPGGRVRTPCVRARGARRLRTGPS